MMSCRITNVLLRAYSVLTCRSMHMPSAPKRCGLQCILQVPDTVEAAIREADVLDQDGNISLAEFEALMHSADTDVLELFDTRHHS